MKSKNIKNQQKQVKQVPRGNPSELKASLDNADKNKTKLSNKKYKIFKMEKPEIKNNEKEISELNNQIKGWEKLFEEEQIAKEQAQEEVRSLREKLDNNQKDVLGIMKLVLDSPEMDRKRVNEVYLFINLVENKLKRLEQ